MIGLSLCSWNANGILAKINEFKLFVEKYSPDLILVQETKLRPIHNIRIANYTCYRNDRVADGHAVGGGTLIMIKNSINHFNMQTPQLQYTEATIVTINPPNFNPLTIISIYIPPSSDNRLFTLDIENLIQINSSCVIFGDFNATHNAWNCSINSVRGKQLKNFTDILDIEIAFPDTPTRFGNHSANTLDFALINNFHYPYSIISIPELSSDHNPVILNFTFNKNIHNDNTRAVTTCWSEFSEHIKNNIHISDFEKISNPNILENKINLFTEAVRSAYEHASRPITNKNHTYTPHHIQNLIRQKNKARKTFQNTLNPIHKTTYNRLQKLIKKELKKFSDQTWKIKLEAMNTQDNTLWQYQNFFRKKRSDIPSLNNTAITDEQKAELLAKTFQGNFTENIRPTNFNTNIDSIVTNTLENFFSNPPSFPITPTDPIEIINYAKNLKNNKSPGADKITNKMIKKLPLKAILTLTFLINKILKLRHFPNNWKNAIIFPIKKPGKNNHQPSSYRPICLLSSLSKITEHIILNRINTFISESNLINPNQFGFTKRLSTCHPLLRLTEKITSGFQRGRSTGAVFLDIQKAFDRVWIGGLIYKLITNNFPPALIHLINPYLTNRSYQVRVKNSLSNIYQVNLGAPQGSLLGPIIFNIYINDIPTHPHTSLNIYADDTAIATTFKNHKSITKHLNNHLKLLETYFNTWKIKLNVEKTIAVLFTRKRKAATPPTLYSTPLQWSQNTIYLGLLLDNKLTWRQHILYTRNKFRNALRLIYPLICRDSTMTRDNKVLLYTAVLRPILSYGCPVWGYAAKSNLKILEISQNKTIRMIVHANMYMKNTHIYEALKLQNFKSYIQKIAINFFNSLPQTNNYHIINLEKYTPNDNTKRPRRILLDSYNPP
ncbi:probable RNA-directed DNA polymerase from transposon X-element [Trichonephila clavipes]|nr:probable RNA-directed DNA polymerase from transposon X-element [Trichonephila clavipes]